MTHTVKTNGAQVSNNTRAFAASQTIALNITGVRGSRLTHSGICTRWATFLENTYFKNEEDRKSGKQ